MGTALWGAMSLFKRRPEVTLRGPKVVSVGRSSRFYVTLHCASPIEVDEVTFELEVSALPVTGYAGNKGLVRGTPLTRYSAVLVRGRSLLEAGDHEYEAVVALAAAMPGTYAGRSLIISWTGRVHVDIPWWPDARTDFSLNVAGQGAAELAPPRIFVSDMAGPQGRGPYSELSLASTTIEPGGHITGHVALANVASNRYRELRFALVAVEKQRGYSTLDRPVRWAKSLEGLEENKAVPFRLRLPAALTPGFSIHRTSLEWKLEVEVDVAWARNPVQWVPLEVRALRVRADSEEIEASPLAVGSDRLAKVWRAAARAAGFSYEGDQLVRLIDGAAVAVRRQHRSRKGVMLVAEATLPEVNIGLHADNGRLRCRDARHSERIAAATDALGATLSLLEASDARLRWSQDDAGTRLESLTVFAQATAAFVQALIDVRADLPAPVAVVDLEKGFARVARALGGTLRSAAMDIRGVRAEVPFCVEMRWDTRGELLATALTVHPLIPIDARFHGAWRRAETPEILPPGLSAVIAEADGVCIDAESIEVYFSPRPSDIDGLVDSAEALIAVGLSLSLRASGYR